MRGEAAEIGPFAAGTLEPFCATPVDFPAAASAPLFLLLLLLLLPVSAAAPTAFSAGTGSEATSAPSCGFDLPGAGAAGGEMEGRILGEI